MRILVLGGTLFLGRHVVDAALASGHEVTLFNRGRTRPELFPDVEKLHGDRDGELGALSGRTFDAVVDTSGYLPRVVEATLDALGDVGHYAFVSSVSVYADLSTPAGEDAPRAVLEEETEDYRSPAYGPLKALCEDVVRARFPEAFVVRPGLIVGPWDPTGRFTYWPERFLDPGPVLAPAPVDAPAQVIDARDLAAWIVHAAEQRVAGTFNAVAPPTTRGELIETCRLAAGSDAEIVWVDPEFLVEHEVGEWMELPLWLHDAGYAAMLSTPVERALAAGLQIRPLIETVAATLEWVASEEHDPSDPRPAGLARAKERARARRLVGARAVRHIVVTGGGTGIGRAIARRLHADGARLTLVARDGGRLRETAPTATIRTCDVRDREQVATAFAEPLDALVANAGIGGPNGPADEGGDRFEDLVQTNVLGTYWCCRAAEPLLPDGGRIVVVASILARIGVPGYTGYCASKAGLLGLVRALAAELAPRRIQVNAVCPGWVDTEMAWQGLDAMPGTREEAFADAMREVPLRRMSEPAEIAAIFRVLPGTPMRARIDATTTIRPPSGRSGSAARQHQYVPSTFVCTLSSNLSPPSSAGPFGP